MSALMFLMYVIKRNGKRQCLDTHKIFKRIKNASRDLENVDAKRLTYEILAKLPDNISTNDIDECIANVAIDKVFENVEYDTLASNIVISNHQRKIKDSFSVIMNKLCVEDGIVNPIYNVYIQENAKVLDEAIDYKRDFLINFSSFKTLNKYLLKNSRGEVVERPQHMMMRVAVCVSDTYSVQQRLEKIIETYNALSLKQYTHNTPTLFHACTNMSYLSTGFLLAPRANDAIGLTETFADIARIAVNTGRVGLNLQDYPALGSYLQGANTVSPGSIPMIKTLNNLLSSIDNRRRVAIAVYTEPWHPDIFNFLALKQIDSDGNQLIKDIFFGLWMPDLFMKRLEKNSTWTLMCPKMCPGLSDVWGEDFERLYEQYEEQYPYLPRVPCSDIWSAVIKSQLETGMPSICYKDAVNRKSNQKHIGTIKCSNFSTECMEYSSHDETAVCNLASIAVNNFVNEEEGTFDFEKLREITKLVTTNLDNSIRATYYHTKNMSRSNYSHRPIGIGVQGLADTFAMLGYAFDSAEARELDVRIFESMYYAAVETSCELAKESGVYSSYKGSPASRGKLQIDMWREENLRTIETTLDWDKLKREKLSKYGMCNSYLLALMPTPCTATILGNNESIEPFSSNIITTKLDNKKFLTVVNKHLVKRLKKQGMWNPGLCNLLATTRGSIQDIDGIDADTKLIFRTVWEIPQKSLVEMAAARAPFIDQSQFLNIHISASPYQKLFAKVNTLHRTIWSKGLKTGLYHLRKGPDSIQLTANEEKARETREILATKPSRPGFLLAYKGAA